MSGRLAMLFILSLAGACGGGQGGGEAQAIRLELSDRAAGGAHVRSGKTPGKAVASQMNGRAHTPDEVILALETGTRNELLEAIDVLSRSRDDRVVGLLQQASLDPSPEVRGAVVDALADVGTEEAILGLTFALSDPDFSVREEAVEVLEEVGGTTALDLLTQALSDEDTEIRALASGAIGTIQRRQRSQAVATMPENGASE